MTETCTAGHPQTPGNTYSDATHPRRCAPCQRALARESYDKRHAGHDVITTARRTIDGLPVRRCRTCTGPRAYNPPQADTAAVLRAVQGDPPPALNVTERREAVLALHGALSGRLIAQRIGVSPRTVWRHLAAVRSGAAA